MKLRRMLLSLRLATARGGRARARVLRDYAGVDRVGADVTFQPRRLPLYPELIRLHDNVAIARNVDFCTHDIMHGVFNRYLKTESSGEAGLRERVGCIEVGENSFIGSNVIIIYGSKIEKNVVVASGSVVVGHLEANSVYAGVPARRVGSYQQLVETYKADQANGRMATVNVGQEITGEEVRRAWELFDAEIDQ